jgi:hypothetical protein
MPLAHWLVSNLRKDLKILLQPIPLQEMAMY